MFTDPVQRTVEQIIMVTNVIIPVSNHVLQYQSGLGKGINQVQVTGSSYRVNNPITCTGNLNLLMSVTGSGSCNLNPLRPGYQVQVKGQVIGLKTRYYRVINPGYWVIITQ